MARILDDVLTQLYAERERVARAMALLEQLQAAGGLAAPPPKLRKAVSRLKAYLARRERQPRGT